jgi:hypothetical protein
MHHILRDGLGKMRDRGSVKKRDFVAEECDCFWVRQAIKFGRTQINDQVQRRRVRRGGIQNANPSGLNPARYGGGAAGDQALRRGRQPRDVIGQKRGVERETLKR